MNEVEPQQTQDTFQETPYEDQSWEIVGEVEEDQEFVPMEVPILSKGAFATDPMLANFGSEDLHEEEDENVKRWHLPEGESAASYSVDNSKEEEI